MAEADQGSPGPAPGDRTAIDRLLDHLAALAELPDQQAARGELARYLGAMEPLPGRHWTQFSPRAVVASALWGAGREADAFGLAIRAVRLDKPDDLGTMLVDRGRTASYQSAIDAVHAKRPDMARSILRRAIDSLGGISPLGEEQALLELIAYVEAVAHDPARFGPLAGRPTVVAFGIWGDRFIEAAERTILPCCLAPGNVPALKEHGPVFIHIHTRARDAERIRALPVIRALAEHARIELPPIPEPLFIPTHMWGSAVWNRNILAAIEYDSLMFARSLGADLMPLGSDMLLSNGCLSAAKRTLMSGYDVVAAAPLRVTAEKVLPRLEAGGHRRNLCLDIPAERLYRLSLEALHPYVRDTFMLQKPRLIAADPHQFQITVGDGFAVHAIQLHAFAFSARPVPEDIGFDSQTLDCRLLSDLLAGRDRKKACFIHAEPPGEMYYCGIDSEAGVAAFGSFEVSPAGLAASAMKWVARPEDLDHFIWSAGQRIHYRLPPDLKLDLPSGCRDEETAVKEIAGLIEAGRARALARIAPYRR